MKFDSGFGEELVVIIDRVDGWTLNQGLSKNLFHTKTLCHCYLHSIGQVIRGTIAAISIRDVQVYDIVSRSLVEYLLDLMLIANRDDESFNRRFAGFHKLTLYDKRETVDHYRDELPRVERDYYNSLLAEYPDLLDAESESGTGVIAPNWKAIGKKVRHLSRQGWTGLSFPEKLITVLVEVSCGYRAFQNPAKQWQKMDTALRRKDPDNWANLSFLERADQVLRELQNQSSGPSSGLQALDQFLEIAQKQFKLGSESVHPTPRSVVPHLNLETYTFELQYRFDDSTLEDAERFLFLTLTSSVDTASPIFGPVDGQTLSDDFRKWCNQSPRLSKWFYSQE